MERHFLARRQVEAAGDPFHLRMSPRPRCEVLELTAGVSGVETGDARHQMTVTLALHAVARTARGGSPRAPAAESDELAGPLKRIGDAIGRAAGGGAQQREQGEYCISVHHQSKPTGRRRGSERAAAIAALMAVPLLVACKQQPIERFTASESAVVRGRALVEATGCTACHAFSDIEWPRGRAGPSLEHFDGRGPIAGTLPNTPSQLAAFVRNAPATKPGSTMPAMPLTASEARDVAAYLYSVPDDR